MRAFVDSNIFIYAIQAHPAFGKKCRQIIQDIEAGKISAFSSSLNLGEIGEVVARHYGRAEAVKAVSLVSALPMGIEPVSKENIIDANSIFSKYNINFSDAVVVSVMREKFIDTILTNDSHFRKVKEIKAITPEKY